MALPKFLQPYLAGYNLAQLNAKEDKRLIITEILNKGNDQALHWLGKTYSQREIKSVIASPIRGMWLENTLSYWQKIFDLRLDKKTFKQAILDLWP